MQNTRGNLGVDFGFSVDPSPTHVLASNRAVVLAAVQAGPMCECELDLEEPLYYGKQTISTWTRVSHCAIVLQLTGRTTCDVGRGRARAYLSF